MKRLTVSFLLLIVYAVTTLAQEWPFEYWHEGKIVLMNGDTLKGNVKYDLQQDLVQYESNSKPEAFTPRKVLYFEIFDKTVNQYRTFYALPYNATQGYRTSIFFELLEEGKITLLAREAIEYRTYSASYYFGSMSREVLVYKYYFLEEDGNIVEFKGNKSDLLNMMGNKSDDVEEYIRSSRLKFEEKYDLARIVAYYNSLVGI
jgi:hypothetical protein